MTVRDIMAELVATASRIGLRCGFSLSVEAIFQGGRMQANAQGLSGAANILALHGQARRPQDR